MRFDLANHHGRPHPRGRGSAETTFGHIRRKDRFLLGLGLNAAGIALPSGRQQCRRPSQRRGRPSRKGNRSPHQVIIKHSLQPSARRRTFEHAQPRPVWIPIQRIALDTNLDRLQLAVESTANHDTPPRRVESQRLNPTIRLDQILQVGLGRLTCQFIFRRSKHGCDRPSGHASTGPANGFKPAKAYPWFPAQPKPTPYR